VDGITQKSSFIIFFNLNHSVLICPESYERLELCCRPPPNLHVALCLKNPVHPVALQLEPEYLLFGFPNSNVFQFMGCHLGC
jgi:hypothetical protein